MAKAKPKLPKFAKRHYERIATVIQGLVLSHRELSECELNEFGGLRRSIAAEFAEMLGKDNPRFDRDRFERACVPGANVRARTANKGNGQALPSNQWRG